MRTRSTEISSTLRAALHDLLGRLRKSVGAVALVFGLAPSCSDQALEVDPVDSGEHALVHQGSEADRPKILEALELWASPETGRFQNPLTKESVEGVEPPVRPERVELPYQCEDFEVVVSDKGKLRHRRLRHEWTQEDRQRFKKLVELVADEMGADPRLLRLWALRESTYNPHAIHVLNPDLRAADRSWERHRYTPEKEARLQAVMKKAGAKKKAYWSARSDLARLKRFAENQYFDDLVEYDLVYADGTRARK